MVLHTRGRVGSRRFFKKREALPEIVPGGLLWFVDHRSYGFYKFYKSYGTYMTYKTN